MYLTASWDLPGIDEDSKGKLKGDKLAFFRSRPRTAARRSLSSAATTSAVWGVRQGEGRAKDFVKLASGKEWGVKYAKEAACLPVYPDALAALSATGPGAVRRRLRQGQRPSRPARTGPRPTRPRRCCRTRARTVIEGKSSADDALAKANKELEDILNAAS